MRPEDERFLEALAGAGKIAASGDGLREADEAAREPLDVVRKESCCRQRLLTDGNRGLEVASRERAMLERQERVRAPSRHAHIGQLAKPLRHASREF